jgi:hypothetical protein
MLRFIIPAVVLTTFCQASHYELLSPDDKTPIQCLVQDLRHPQWTKGHYLACYSQYFRTKENWGGYFYGGFVASPGQPANLIQFSSWQMSGKGVPAADIDFAHAGKHMSWAKSTWEGSAGGIKGKWPVDEFKENEWHRFVARTWVPQDDPAHSCVGIWMRNVKSGVWNHLATTRYPGEIVNLSHFFGFQENFTGGGADPVALLDIRNTYSQRNGKWVADNKCLFRPQGDGDKKERLRLKTIENGKALSLSTLWSYTQRTTPEQKNDPEFKPENQQITYTQPAQPTFFDPVKVTSFGASASGSQMYVKWDLAADSCPQLGYKLEIFAKADGSGVPLQVLSGNDPDRRNLLIDSKAGLKSSARLTLTDIYGNQAKSITRAASPAKPSAAKNPQNLVPGLAYHYYEAPDKTSWATLPDFTKLTPVREGAVSEPDISPRQKRANYAFDFIGLIQVATPGIYDFSLVHASGARLIVDGQTVIDAADYHSIRNVTGAIPLTAGKHSFVLQYVQGEKQTQQADDFLQLLWAGHDSGGKFSRIPTSAWYRMAAIGEPLVTFTAPSNVSGHQLKLAAEVTKLNGAPDSIQYYMVNPTFDYFRAQGAQGGDYFIGETKDAATPLDTMLWGSAEKTIRARLIYGKNRSIDSAPVTFKTTAPDLKPWTLTELEHHQYPVAAQVTGNTISMVGESMALFTQPMTGDCTLIARLASITPQVRAPDGSEPGGSQWQAGIILRNDLGASPGEPLGGNTEYSALLGAADGSIRHCDSLMKNGAGNQPSGNLGSNKRWLKLQRSGQEFTESISEDGQNWTVAKTLTLPKMGSTLHAGLFLYALPSATTLVHRATFDNVTLTPGVPK